MMNDSFLSIVAHRERPEVLLVRARMAGDLEAVFPEVKTWHDPFADYPYRAEIAREEVAAVISMRIGKIEYDNFKSSVAEKSRHDAYMAVWTEMWRWGQRSIYREFD